MSHTTIISPEQLHTRLDDKDWAIIDCRFDLADTEAGWHAYQKNHIPGAIYAHLERDLSGSVTADSGRHPLPNIEVFAEKLGKWGIDTTTQVVAYDDSAGAIAARLWWMLRYLGHQAVAVLDSGFSLWCEQNYPIENTIRAREPRKFSVRLRQDLLVSLAQLKELRGDSSYRLIDSRDPRRYRGEFEPIDPIAGHIPGAINHFHGKNVEQSGKMRDPQQLREEFTELLAGTANERAIFYCGSGVTACRNLLAMEHAGLSGAKLYAGSWSQWCSDPARGVARG